MAFHEVRFPTDISLGATGGPERRTDVVVLGSGHEERNSRWADSRRRYNAGYGLRDLNDLYEIMSFFEDRRGKLHGFRWKDHADFRSGPVRKLIAPTDQIIGVGDGLETEFQLRKSYGSVSPWVRTIAKPVASTVRVAVNGTEAVAGVAFSVDTATGIVSFLSSHEPPAGSVVTAGFEFDVPTRFDTDALELNVAGFRHGSIPSIPIVEVRL